MTTTPESVSPSRTRTSVGHPSVSQKAGNVEPAGNLPQTTISESIDSSTSLTTTFPVSTILPVVIIFSLCSFVCLVVACFGKL